MQVRRLLRGLVAVRVEATDEINYSPEREREREMTSLHFPISLVRLLTERKKKGKRQEKHSARSIGWHRSVSDAVLKNLSL